MGRSISAVVLKNAIGSEAWEEEKRHEGVPARLLGGIVKAKAWDNRR